MSGESARHLRSLLGRRVVVDPSEPAFPPGTKGSYLYGVLTELRPSGPRVRLDGENRDRTFAAWRISAAPSPRGGGA